MYMPEREFSLKRCTLFILMAASLFAVMALNMPMVRGVLTKVQSSLSGDTAYTHSHGTYTHTHALSIHHD
jgi:ABC-type Co2+ transport system permease subunit